MRLCKDCQYFALLEEWRDPPGFGDCNSEKFIEYNYAADSPPNDSLVKSDWKGCQSYVKVGPNFGCIHFAPREEK
jgi:hypothetical protein